MTAIVPDYVKTKKLLKELLSQGNYMELTNPTPWGDELYMLNTTHIYPAEKGGPLTEDYKIDVYGKRTILPCDYKIYCTNHPKRSWFAQLTLTEKGWKVS